MEKMVNSNGAQVNMCCASCEHLSFKIYGPGIRGIKRWCKKKNAPVLDYGKKCSYYVINKFFREKGYKPMKD